MVYSHAVLFWSIRKRDYCGKKCMLLAKAIVAYGTEKHTEQIPVTEFKALPGNGLEGKGNAAERLISGEHHVLHEYCGRRGRDRPHPSRCSMMGASWSAWMTCLVAQIETRGKEKINGNGGEKGGEDDGAGIHGSRGFFCVK